MYNVLKFVHVTSIAIWLGALVTLLLLNRFFTSAGDHAAVQAIGRQGARFSTRLFLPAVLVTLVSGIGMVQVNDIGFGTTWIVFGIIGLVASMIIGGALTGGTARKLGARIAAGDIDASGIAAVQRRLLMYSIINVVLLLSIIWAMVTKPS